MVVTVLAPAASGTTSCERVVVSIGRGSEDVALTAWPSAASRSMSCECGVDNAVEEVAMSSKALLGQEPERGTILELQFKAKGEVVTKGGHT